MTQTDRQTDVALVFEYNWRVADLNISSHAHTHTHTQLPVISRDAELSYL
jgi:hypothetical protein